MKSKGHEKGFLTTLVYGDGPPGHGYEEANKYSWVSYAATQGYPTLAIDGLGSGDSSHQDPVLVLQTLAEIDVLHRVVQAARTAKITAIPTTEQFWRMFCKSN